MQGGKKKSKRRKQIVSAIQNEENATQRNAHIPKERNDIIIRRKLCEKEKGN